ncbi:MAG TPA: hypothetical protein VGI70_21145, partial [Polyangiales bacterium]
WQFEAIMWRRRSSLKGLLARALEPDVDPIQLALSGAKNLSANDVERFWSELVPLIASPNRDSFDSLPGTVQTWRERFGRRERRAQYRLLQRFSLILVARLEPLFLHRGQKPLIPVKTYFHLWMLVQHIVGSGRAAYLAAVADPQSVGLHVPELTSQSGLYALSLFRFDETTFDAQKLRLLEAYFHPHDQAKKRANHERNKAEDLSAYPITEQRAEQIGRAAFGLVSLMPVIRENFRGPDFDKGYPELYPVFVEHKGGDVVVGEYKRPGDVVLAPDLKSVRS